MEEIQNKRKWAELEQMRDCNEILDRHCKTSLPSAAREADSHLQRLDSTVLELTKVIRSADTVLTQ